ncbi:hypothetical protein HDU67_009815 [Dinochytrium kinnereticum]|nr:hypothetical protein HDU67_009815 [Dinochytrium kinnereticum]
MVLQVLIAIILMLLPVSIMFVSLVGAIIYPVIFQVLEAGGIYPERIVTSSEAVQKCYRIGENLRIACEDVSIHHPSGTAFLACDDLDSRLQYWPPLDHHNTSFAGTGMIYKLDLKTNEFTKLDLDGVSLTTHGIGLWWDPETPEDVIMNLVNHQPGGSSIEIFEHSIGSNSLKHLETFKDPVILKSPNSVQPVGRKSFYATNDKKYLEGHMKVFEQVTMTVMPYTHVVYRNEEGEASIVANKLKYANGIVASPHIPLLYVVSLGDHAVFVYERKSNGTLRYKERVILDFFPDNIKLDPKTGAIYAAGFPKVLDAFKHFNEPSHKSPTWIARIFNNTDDYDKFLGKNYYADGIVVDSGDLISAGTTAAVDPDTNKTVIAGIYSNGVVVCDDAFTLEFDQEEELNAVGSSKPLPKAVEEEKIVVVEEEEEDDDEDEDDKKKDHDEL